MRNWLGLIKCMGLFGMGSGYSEDDLVRVSKTREIPRDHGRLRRKGIKTPFGTPPIDDAAQAAWDRAKRAGGKVYPRSSVTEVARRATQIAAGQLTRSNGLVWPGQLASRMWKKGLGTGLFLRKPHNL